MVWGVADADADVIVIVGGSMSRRLDKKKISILFVYSFVRCSGGHDCESDDICRIIPIRRCVFSSFIGVLENVSSA